MEKDRYEVFIDSLEINDCPVRGLFNDSNTVKITFTTADPPYAYWTMKPDNSILCSNCFSSAFKAGDGNTVLTDYCPFCGAFMNIGGDNGTV